MSIEVNNESGADIDEKSLAELGRFVLDDLGIDPLADLSVLLVDTDTMASLHQQWMDLPGPTDVMAFPMDGADGGVGERVDPSAPPGTDENPGETMLGDVVLCPSVAADQAASAGHSLDAELHLLCAHGILHLLGYDHGEPDEEREMFELQARLTRDWSKVSGVGEIRSPLPGTAGEVRYLMTGGAAIALLVAILLVPIGGLFACVDSALARVSKARVDEFVREEAPGAKALSAIVDDRPRYTNLLLMLRVSCEVTATVLVAIVARSLFGTRWPVGLLVVVIMIVVVYAVIGVGPRTLGRQHFNRVALTAAPAVRALGRMFNPLAALLILLGNAITPGRGLRDGPFASEVELRELVDMAEERGVVEADERQMIQSVFELGNTIAREVMVPRTEVVWIEKHKTVRSTLALALRSGFSRIPVVGENADDVVGVVYLKDLARRAQDAERAKTTTAEEIMRTVAYVPESKPVDALLREMQAARSHIAIVIDEYGGTAGLITIEDILEEIVGEITDEYDVERAPIERLAEDDGEVNLARVTSRLAVEDLAELFDVEIPDRDDVETVGGLLAEALGRVPIAGSVAVVHGLELKADEVGGRRNRVDSILVTRVVEPDESDDETSGDEERETAHATQGTLATDTTLDPEDAKLVTLARSARARTGATQGAAVRDGDGRTYVATAVDLPSLSLSALQVAVAMAVSSGAPGLEAAVVLGDDPADPAGELAVRDVSPIAAVLHAKADGSLV